MKRTTYFLFIFYICLCACDTPLRHMRPERVTFYDNTKKIVSLNKTLNVEISWLKGPFGLPDKTSSLEVIVLDQSLNPIKLNEGDQFYIQADMGMGHGLASAGTFYSDEDSSYWVNSSMSFYMGGDYQIKLYLFDENFNEIGVAEWRVVF